MTTARSAGSLTPARHIPGPGPAPAHSDPAEHAVRTQRADPRIDLPLLVGLAAVGFTALYLISDLIEVARAASRPSGSR